MKRIKEILFIVILINISFESHAQIQKFRTTLFNYVKFDPESGKQTETGDWEDHSVLVVFDIGQERITVYDTDILKFDNVKSSIVENTPDKLVRLQCIDGNGKEVTLYFGSLEGDDEYVLYIVYSGIKFMYSMYILP